MKNKNNEQAVSPKVLSFSAVRKIFLICFILSVIFILLGRGIYTYIGMKQTVKTMYQSVSAQTSAKVDESLKLLNSLASLEVFYDPDVAWEEKTAKLDKINEYYGYMFICYVDEDIVVYTLGEEPASLASREHMQKVYASKQPYVTDSFVAGADGKTLNYTVIVPLFKDSVMTGSLFATIVLNDTEELLKEITSTTNAEAILISSKGQVMCSTNKTAYGTSILDILSSHQLYNTTADQLEEQMLNRQMGAFRSRDGFNFIYTEYGPVENTNWDILVSIDFGSEFLAMLPLTCSVMVCLIALIITLYYFVNRHIRLQSENIQSMVQSVQSLKKKIYQNNDPAELLDYENLIRMSSKGLNDDLTGASTRAVFLNQAEALLKETKDNQILVLCFIDLDDLKTLNDKYGHSTGDIALKKTGNTLREYAMKYDGLVGRYGGDEFILILRDLDNGDELNAVLQELIERLKFDIQFEDKKLAIHCSIGASLWEPDITLNTLISNADKALYDVKRHGKAMYSVFLNGEHNEV